jgi:two-component system, sensor histidine kinase PdtaS
VATFYELAESTGLDEPAIDHLVGLTASWSLLADLAFSDLLLMVRAGDGSLLVLAQARPNNRTTSILDDLVGTAHDPADWPLVERALSGTRALGETHRASDATRLDTWAVPVGFNGRTIAAAVRLQGGHGATASVFEAPYLSIFARLCTMVTDGTFPFREDTVAGPGLPRVGDGVVLVDRAGRVELATPNAVNALHRLGIYTSAEGRTLDELGLTVRAVDRALAFGLPSLEEVDAGPDVAIQVLGVPLVEDGAVTGVVTLTRDVSDLRHLNRMVLNRETAVREVHHRVKNNLQTISSLLRLQARRSEQEETRTALNEAERRVRSIAVVHEVLSREPGEEVDFDEIVQSVVALVEDTSLSEGPVEIVVEGDLGVLATDLATPLSVVLAELLTNALEHAFTDRDPGDGRVGVVTVRLWREGATAVCEIRDNGRGLRADFSLEVPTSLGLSIVRDLVRNQLLGAIEMRSADPAEGGGTYVRVSVPIP